MYSILVAIAIGAAAGVAWTLAGLWKTWAFGIVLFFVVGITAFALISRRFSRRIEPLFLQAQKQMQSGAHRAAMSTLEGLLPLARWQVMLAGQVNAQLGMLAFTTGDEERAESYLGRASSRVAEAQLFRASLLFKRRRAAEAFQVLDRALSSNKKKLLLYHVYAWMLEKEGRHDDAVEMLLRAQKVEKGHEATRDNLLRLQNGKKMNMKPFQMEWYALQLEAPPRSFGQQQAPVRKGFRQKKKRR